MTLGARKGTRITRHPIQHVSRDRVHGQCPRARTKPLGPRDLVPRASGRALGSDKEHTVTAPLDGSLVAPGISTRDQRSQLILSMTMIKSLIRVNASQSSRVNSPNKFWPVRKPTMPRTSLLKTEEKRHPTTLLRRQTKARPRSPLLARAAQRSAVFSSLE